MMSFLYCILLLAQERSALIIQVEGIETLQGQVMVAVYDGPDNFMDEDRMHRAEVVGLGNGSPSVSIELPAGTYAVSLFHDLNSNKKLVPNGTDIHQIQQSVNQLFT